MAIQEFSRSLGLDLQPIPKLVLVTLADHANDKGYAWPSKDTIASIAGVEPRTVQKNISKFKEDGVIYCVANEYGGRGKTPVYAFDLDRAEELYGICKAERIKRERAIERRKLRSGQAKIKGEQTSNSKSQKGDAENRKGEYGDTKGSTGSLPNYQEPLKEPITPQSPPEGVRELFKRLMSVHPGSHLGNSERAQEIFSDKIFQGYDGEALIKAACSYDDKIIKSQTKPCKLERWLSERRYRAEGVIDPIDGYALETKPEVVGLVENTSNNIEPVESEIEYTEALLREDTEAEKLAKKVRYETRTDFKNWKLFLNEIHVDGTHADCIIRYNPVGHDERSTIENFLIDALNHLGYSIESVMILESRDNENR